jgi:hypothetical protein
MLINLIKVILEPSIVSDPDQIGKLCYTDFVALYPFQFKKSEDYFSGNG